MPENLNIAWNHKRMIIFALKHFDTQQQAADALGISTRTLVRLKKQYNVKTKAPVESKR